MKQVTKQPMIPQGKEKKVRESVPKRYEYHEIGHKTAESPYQKRRETEKSVPKKVNFQQISHTCGGI